MRINKNPELLKVGSIVETDFYPGQEHILLHIDRIVPDKTCGSKFRASASALQACRACGKSHHVTPAIDASWFIPVEENNLLNPEGK